MARRTIGEINAGSMADIAFLLLIFFLVTTTMDVDSGIAQNMPIKHKQPPKPPVPERNVLKIQTNVNNELMVEGELTSIAELPEAFDHFYFDNADGQDNNPDMPLYTAITTQLCEDMISVFQAQVNGTGDNLYNEDQLSTWTTKLAICKLFNGTYMEISKSAIIQYKFDSKTSYGLYIQIQNELKRHINKLRVAKCKELNWPNYFELDKQKEEDQQKLRILKILVPERMIESEL